MRVLLTFLILTAAAAGAALPVRAGRLAGTVDLSPAPPVPRSVDLYGKYNTTRPAPPPKHRPAVVALVPVNGSVKLVPSKAPVMDQEDLQFKPHVLPVVRGTRVRFTNSDQYFHNVFSLSPSKKFDLGRYAKGDSRYVVFDRTGVVNVFCDIHAEMRAYVLVLETSLFTVTDAEGAFAIEDVPAGEYEVLVWHEDLSEPARVRRISIPRSGTTTFSAPLPAVR